jgi:DNA-binding transcriptional LysR family regulator
MDNILFKPLDNAMEDLNDLVIFAKIVELRSFSAAARSLGMPKSNVSYRMTRLEERLGVRLLQRTTRSLNVTSAGEIYYQHCRTIAQKAEEASAAIHNIQAQPRGLLRVSFPVAFGSIFLLPLIIDFLTLYPEVRMMMLSSDRRVDLIEENFDVAIRIGRLQPSAMIARRLGSLHQHLFASPKYLARRGTPVSPEELDSHECLGFGENMSSAQWTLIGPGATKVVSFQPRSAGNDPIILRSLVIGGLGIAMISDILCHQFEASGEMVRVLPEWSAPPIDCHALFPSHKGLSVVVRTFLDYVVAKFAL